MAAKEYPWDFSLALRSLRTGSKLARDGWNGKGLYITYVDPTGDLTKPFLCLNYADGERVPWVPSQTDVLASDWRII